jgi:hypothetical protein
VSRSLQATLTHSLGRRNQSSRTCHAYGTESCSRQAWMVALIRPAASAQDQCALAELASWKRTTFPVRAPRPPGAVWEGHKHQPHRAHGSSRATLRRARPTQDASMWSRISCSRPRSLLFRRFIDLPSPLTLRADRIYPAERRRDAAVDLHRMARGWLGRAEGN